MKKSILRETMLGIAKNRTDEEVLSAEIVRRLRTSAVWESAARICAFCALGGEPDIFDLWSDGKQMALPRVDGNDLSWHWITCRAELAPGNFGVFEPCASAPLAGVAFDLILVPGIAFDRQGGRLGRGCGYYDRFLAKASGLRLGVCFNDQIVKEVPCYPHDVRMDAIITPLEMMLCGPKNIP